MLFHLTVTGMQLDRQVSFPSFPVRRLFSTVVLDEWKIGISLDVPSETLLRATTTSDEYATSMLTPWLIQTVLF